MTLHDAHVGAGAEITPAQLRELYRVTPEDQERIRALGATAGDHMDQIVDSFYAWLKEEPWFEEYFSDPEVLERITGEQREYWAAFMTSDIDDDYVHHRHVVGETHARIGLPMNAFFAVRP